MAYSVGWGAEIGLLGQKVKTAREALALAEEHLGTGRADVVVIDLKTNSAVAMDDLRELAEQEVDEEPG
jgi:hypothetical protein